MTLINVIEEEYGNVFCALSTKDLSLYNNYPQNMAKRTKEERANAESLMHHVWQMSNPDTLVDIQDNGFGLTVDLRLFEPMIINQIVNLWC